MKTYIYFAVIIIGSVFSSCIAPGKYYSESLFFSKKCSTCLNSQNESPGICFARHWVRYGNADSSQVLSVVVPNPVKYKYDKNWLVAKNHKHYYIIPLYDDSLALHSYRKYEKFKETFSSYSIPDSLMIAPID